MPASTMTQTRPVPLAPVETRKMPPSSAKRKRPEHNANREKPPRPEAIDDDAAGNLQKRVRVIKEREEQPGLAVRKLVGLVLQLGVDDVPRVAVQVQQERRAAGEGENQPANAGRLVGRFRFIHARDGLPILAVW